jgi:hypothetical protein
MEFSAWASCLNLVAQLRFVRHSFLQSVDFGDCILIIFIASQSIDFWLICAMVPSRAS